MSARIALWTTLIVFTGFIALLFVNAINGVSVVPSKYLSPNDVRGMATEHQGLLYTLNFEQQNTLINVFNHADPLAPNLTADNKQTPPHPSPVSQLLVYRFNAPEMTIKLLGFSQNNPQQMIHFQNPEWSPEVLSAPVPDGLFTMLSNTYDHYD